MRRRAHVLRPAAAGLRPTGRGSGVWTRASLTVSRAARSLTAVSAAALLLAGCGSGSGSGSADRLGSRPVSPAVSPAVTGTLLGAPSPAVPDNGPDAAAARQVLALYTGWWQAQATAYSQGSRASTGLRLYATGQALSGSLVNLHRLQEAGMAMQGRPRSNARVTALDLTSTPHTATVEDCLDVSGWHQIDARTKKLRDPRHRLARYTVTATLRTVGKAWLVTRLTSETERTC